MFMNEFIPDSLQTEYPPHEHPISQTHDLYYHEEEPSYFKVGQSYEKQPALKMFCKRCNGDKFYVGQGNFFTAIACINCEWQQGIHEG